MVAKTIIEQMGGVRFLVMTGAKQLVDLGNGLQFKLPRFTGLKINNVRIILNGNDTYDVEFGKVGRANYQQIKTINDVYAEDLQSIFTNTTGLDTRL